MKKTFLTLPLLTLCLAAANHCLAADSFVNAQHDTALVDDRGTEQGFQRLFNGKDLTGWDGNPKLWSVKDGAITGQTTAENPAKGNTFLIWTNGSPGNFELRCSFKLVPGDDKGFANSGVQDPKQDLRSSQLGRGRLPGRHGGRTELHRHSL